MPAHGPPPSPVGRLAPSPTGLLHLGHARTFALAWAHVRARGGSLRLRFDDLDPTRSRRSYVDAALRDLEWLGLDWDGPVWFQSQRVSRLREIAESLVTRGLAFPCVCGRADLAAAVSAPHVGATPRRYPGTCRDRFLDVSSARATGDRVAVRLRVDSDVAFTDRLRGPRTERVGHDVGDFLLLNRQGVPSYQMATAVDDVEQGVTEVFRGDDLLSSAARQLAVLRALDWREPDFFHVSLVTDHTGRRLAKRSDDLSLAALRERRVDPRRVMAWVGASAGLWRRGRATSEDLRSAFDLSKLPAASCRLSEADVAGFFRG